MLNFQEKQNSIIIFLTETKYVIGVIRISMLVWKLFIEISYTKAVGVRGVNLNLADEDRYHYYHNVFYDSCKMY